MEKPSESSNENSNDSTDWVVLTEEEKATRAMSEDFTKVDNFVDNFENAPSLPLPLPQSVENNPTQSPDNEQVAFPQTEILPPQQPTTTGVVDDSRNTPEFSQSMDVQTPQLIIDQPPEPQLEPEPEPEQKATHTTSILPQQSAVQPVLLPEPPQPVIPEWKNKHFAVTFSLLTDADSAPNVGYCTDSNLLNETVAKMRKTVSFSLKTCSERERDDVKLLGEIFNIYVAKDGEYCILRFRIMPTIYNISIVVLFFSL